MKVTRSGVNALLRVTFIDLILLCVIKYCMCVSRHKNNKGLH